MRYYKYLLIMLVVFLSGCLMQPPAPEPVKQVPYNLSVGFSSQLPDLYYVMSGPAFTYARFRVNDRFAALLKRQVTRQSTPDSGSSAQLTVKITALHTDFEEIGMAPAKRPIRVAMAAAAGHGRDIGLDLVQDNTDFNLPETTSKSAVMDLQVRLDAGNRPPAERRIHVDYTERHDWYFEGKSVTLNRDRYDYDSVLEGLYREALKKISQFVGETLISPAGSGG